jgi:fatty acid desaturase
MSTSPKPRRQVAVSLRDFVLIVVAAGAAIGAGALAYWHKPWILVGVAAFAATLKFLDKYIK